MKQKKYLIDKIAAMDRSNKDLGCIREMLEEVVIKGEINIELITERVRKFSIL